MQEQKLVKRSIKSCASKTTIVQIPCAMLIFNSMNNYQITERLTSGELPSNYRRAVGFVSS